LTSCAELTDENREALCPSLDGACGCQCSGIPVTECMDFRSGNYQVNDVNTGEVVAHFRVETEDEEPCRGFMTMQKSSDPFTMSLSFFSNRVETVDPEGTLFVGVPNSEGGLTFNEMYAFSFIDCMVIYSGSYDLLQTDSLEHVAEHHMSQDGCHAESRYWENDTEMIITFVMTHETLTGDFNGEILEGHRGAEGELVWSNGHVSYPRWDEHKHECNEDGHRLYEYVRSVVPHAEDGRVSELLQHIEWEGCNLFRHDLEMKEAFCLFHPEVRDACSCVCNESSEPRHVCSPEQFESWMARDLGHECQLLFISGLAEEHRPACDCMRSIPHEAAEELFGSHCYFSSFSDRSFYQKWEDCQHHY